MTASYVMIQITPENLVAAGLAVMPSAADVAPALAAACAKYGIDTGLRVSGFLAQCSHESIRFMATSENLNYSAKGLLTTFPKYFTPELALEYQRQPEKIANRVYANRMGNGDEASGDGWKFRGRGFIQLTGKNNYTAYDSDIMGRGALFINPDIVSMPDHAAGSAAWYWKKHGLNEIADTGDIVKMTKVINGGTIGLEERKRLYEQALKVFNP